MIVIVTANNEDQIRNEGVSELTILNEPVHEKTNKFGFPTRSDTNHPVQSQKMVRGWKFWI